MRLLGTVLIVAPLLVLGVGVWVLFGMWASSTGDRVWTVWKILALCLCIVISSLLVGLMVFLDGILIHKKKVALIVPSAQ